MRDEDKADEEVTFKPTKLFSCPWRVHSGSFVRVVVSESEPNAVQRIFLLLFFNYLSV
jgi:hypothetical protein